MKLPAVFPVLLLLMALMCFPAPASADESASGESTGPVETITDDSQVPNLQVYSSQETTDPFKAKTNVNPKIFEDSVKLCELILIGTVRGELGDIALFSTARQKSIQLKIDDEIHDAKVKKINSDSVVFDYYDRNLEGRIVQIKEVTLTVEK